MEENGDTKQRLHETPLPLDTPLHPTDTKERLQRAPFETALHHAGYGCFQWLLLMSCGAVYAVCALSTTTLSFVLPAAACDFNLESADKGRLTATPLIGMCVGSYFWGNLADARGRKKAIIGALLLDAVAAFVSSLVQSFPAFLAFRFFSGFGIIGATGLVFPYFGDFLSLRHRDVMLCRLEVFWTIGTILLPGIAWLIIQDPRFNLTAADAAFQYTPWRVFVAACGIPSLLVVLLLIPFPESPRYLLYAHRPEEALKVLQRIFVVNTKLSEKDFPVESMIGAEEDGEDEEVVTADNNNETKRARTFKQRMESFWNRKKMLVSPPYIGFLVLCCFVDFGLMFSYYTLMMWFPDLFERYSQFASLYPDVSAGVCEVSANLTISHTTPVPELSDLISEHACHIDNSVYIHTLIVALSCLPTALWVGLTINMVGKKPMLVLMLTISGCAALGLNLVRSSLENLVLSCIFEAIVSCTEAVLFCVICEIFPTKVAATAMAVTVMCGRIGAIVGNVVFGALVDEHCVVPIYMFGTFLISSGLLCIILPKSTRPERPQV
ncbi:synaptic vesicle glycoprotein 2B-like isoform X2 [Pectinophora gossypiella]|uniref:synaptic vesicle glycoprotein 2B-like isoform X2 n=1 Tax=Pectinophora gossypiella TaxID=13191 RepID=UPI00214DFCE3|nr:synaptic vesicle glycoprotein 2B-like isoform X2 [Pectinophora gossypiella]